MTAFFFSTAVQASILHDSWACSPAREAAAAQDPSSAPAAAAITHQPAPAPVCPHPRPHPRQWQGTREELHN